MEGGSVIVQEGRKDLTVWGGGQRAKSKKSKEERAHLDYRSVRRARKPVVASEDFGSALCDVV